MVRSSRLLKFLISYSAASHSNGLGWSVNVQFISSYFSRAFKKYHRGFTWNHLNKRNLNVYVFVSFEMSMRFTCVCKKRGESFNFIISLFKLLCNIQNSFFLLLESA